MKYALKFTPEAENTFDSIAAQLLKQWGEKHVINFEKSVLKSLETISQTPFIYPVLIPEHNIRKCIVHKNCSILYRVGETTITIICFWDNRQDNVF